MPRPFKKRWVADHPSGTIFKPAGVSLISLAKVTLQFDELEALRQSSFLQRSQEEGAAQMGISRSTFARILDKALRKIADALVSGKAIIIEGGPVIMARRTFICHQCGREWEEPFGTGRPQECPYCKSSQFHRADAGPRGVCGKGPGGGQGRGQGSSNQIHKKGD